ncbi:MULTISPECIES: hypothetical protein [unclassified Mucilaginibacter]|uniref:hypothetical protein n=1 Tax=unclassified Mucilaginibacter TaxID=2617802 RepID=UPI002B228FF3|nr:MULTISPECIES: hypothetical protein [unclassified Mucilaginibacter]
MDGTDADILRRGMSGKYRSKKSLIVCGNEYISCLSLSEYYEHWKNIGYDWVKPADQEAWVFLNQKAIKNCLY